MLPRYLSTRIVFDPNEIFRIEFTIEIPIFSDTIIIAKQAKLLSIFNVITRRIRKLLQFLSCRKK